MGKPKMKLAMEEKLAKDRLRKKIKYQEIKSDPELYKIQKEKERIRYIMRKENKKLKGIQEMSKREQRDQRRRWRKNSSNYNKKLKEQKKIQAILLENSPPPSDTEEIHDAEPQEPLNQPAQLENDPLMMNEVMEPGDENRKKNASKQTTTMRDIRSRSDKVLEDLNENVETPQNQPVQLNNVSLGAQITNDLTPVSRMRKIPKQTPSTIRQIRYRSNKVIATLKEEINKLKRDKIILKKKIARERLQKKKITDTIEKKVDNIVESIKQDKVDEVKKQLLFDESFKKCINAKYKDLNKKDKRAFVNEMKMDDRLKKHRVVTKIPFRIRKRNSEEEQGKKDKKNEKNVRGFFEEDVNSAVAPGKAEFVKRAGVIKQKRYMLDNLKNLHVKFCNEKGFISYPTFCRLRPFWVYFPNANRDTCQCKLHANVELLIKYLQKSKIIQQNTATEVVKSLCCHMDRACLEKSCLNCKNKTLNIYEFDNSCNLVYYEWITEKQSYLNKDGEKKFKVVTTKKRMEDKPRNLIIKLDTVLNDLFFEHVKNIVLQYAAIKDLKTNLTNEEVICHIDFSENFSYKYHEEIQSYHFGASRGQVSLHTGILYFLNQNGQMTNKSFCSMSTCLNHDATAIWAHLSPILEFTKSVVPQLTKIHFLSDSPSSQYRNKYIFYMISKLKLQIPTLREVTWNYQEAGHGKGAPDGIGAVVKRAADNFVKFGGDVGNFEDFVEIVKKNVTNVDIYVIPPENITTKRFPDDIPTFKGTTKVHQALWSHTSQNTVALRSLSCFTCRVSSLPCSHHSHLGVLTLKTIETAKAQPKTSSTAMSKQSKIKAAMPIEKNHDLPNTSKDLNDCQYDDISKIQLDSPTIFNNIGNMSLNELDPTMFTENVFSLDTEFKEIKPKPSRVKILSNVQTNYQKFSVQKYQEGFSSVDQTEFEFFLKDLKNQQGIDENVSETKSPMLVDDCEFSNKENIMELENKLHEEVIDAPPENQYKLDEWVIVEYKIKNKCSNYYIGKIIEVLNTQEYKIMFLKKAQGKSLKFGWPTNSDDDIISHSKIVHLLKIPKEDRRGQFTFESLPNLYFK